MKRRLKMKTRTLLITTVLLSVVTVIITGGAKREIHVDEVIKALSHTWVHPDYPTITMAFQKLVVKPDGFINPYDNVDASLDKPVLPMRYTINEAWIDRERNIWFKATINTMTGKIYSLNKLSNTGTEWEYIWSYGDLPDQVDADELKYRIYYRQE
jgi:hypothetical protein